MLGRQRPAVGLIFVFVFVAIGAAFGCGDDEDSNDTAGNKGADRSGIVAEAAKMIEEAKQPLKFEPPGEPIDVSKLKGKTIAIVSVDQRSPVLATTAAEATKAAEAEGVNTTVFDAQAEVSRMNQGIDQAIQNADAILLLGIVIAVVEDKLREAEAAGLPVVSVLNNQPEPDAPGQGAGPLVDATSAPDYRRAGALVAAKAIVDTDGEANVLILTDKQITPAGAVMEGMQSVLSRCSGCDVTEKNVPFGQWATALTPETLSAIRANPELNYVLPIFDSMSIFVTPAIEQAGAADRVRNASVDGTPASLKLIQSGDVYSADVGTPFIWQAWHAVDQAFRGMLGRPPADPTLPDRLLDDSNLSGVDVDDLDAPYGDSLGYREGFKTLWSGG